MEKGEWQRTKTISNAFIIRGDLTKVSKIWFYFVNSVLKSSKHVSTMRQDCIILLYVLVKSFELNVGRIIEESILDYVESKFSGNIPPLLNHPHVHQRRGGGGGGGGGVGVGVGGCV